MHLKKIQQKYVLAGLYLISCFAVIIHMNGLIPADPIDSDGGQNLRMAYHLYKSGVMSNEHEVTGRLPNPTNYREPVPPFVSAVFMALHPAIDKSTTLDDLQAGKNTKHIKQVNLFWIFLLLVGSGLLTWFFSRNRYVPFLVLFLIFTYFIRFGNHFASMFTELAGAVLVIWVTLFLFLAVKKEKIPLYFLAGLFLGLLILTKAVFYYLSAVALIFLIVSAGRIQKPLKIALFIVGVTVVVVPYLIRNYIQFNETSVTQRAGIVLYQRAHLNQMTGEEIKGAIYLWGPELYRDIVDNTGLGVKKRDFEPGGKLVRMNRESENDTLAVDLGRPDLAVAFFHKARAEINRLQRELGSTDKEAPRDQVFAAMQVEAEEMILDKPFRHIALSALFMWRGMWCFPNSTIPFIGDDLQIYIHNLINFLAYLSLFGMFIYGLLKWEKVYLAITLLPVSMLVFQMLITHNISRFSEPAIPSMLICFSIAILLLIQKIYEKDLLPSQK